MLINGLKIGLDEQTYISAEVGAKHNKNSDMANKLMDVAADVKSFAFKFQTYIDETLYSMRC